MKIPLHCIKGNVLGTYCHLGYTRHSKALVSLHVDRRSDAGCMFNFEPSDDEDEQYICYVIDELMVVPFSDNSVYVFVLDMDEETKFQCLLDGSLPSVMRTVTNDKNIRTVVDFDRINSHLEEYRASL